MGSSDDSLGGTVDTFATRLKRRLKEQQTQDDAAKRAAEERHARMLQAMTLIRKALQESCKINLGSRFCFKLKVTDWEGWPKVELCLIDQLSSDTCHSALVVTTHDRDQTGAVCFSSLDEKHLGKVLLADPIEMERLPKLLKKCVRDFLDIISPTVINPKAPTHQETKIELTDQHEGDNVSEQLKGEDVFTEQQYSSDQNRVEFADSDAEPVPVALEK